VRLLRCSAGKCRINSRTSASVRNVITEGMTSGRGRGRDQLARGISPQFAARRDFACIVIVRTSERGRQAVLIARGLLEFIPKKKTQL
jgi:hypothetical protein